MSRGDAGAARPGAAGTRTILVLGGGFGGAYCAERLEKALRGQGVAVVLLDRNNYFVFYPLLIEAGTGTLDARHVVVSLRSFLRRVHFRMAAATALDPAKHEVNYQVPGSDQTGTLHYDHLVIAVGSVTRMPEVPGLREHGFELKSLTDAIALRDRMIQQLELADATDDPRRRQVLLHLVVVGGNYTGVEVAGEFLALMQKAARRYPHVNPADCRATLIERGPRILHTLSENLADYAAQVMRRRGTEIITNATATRIEADRVHLDNGRVIDAHTTIWCAGIAPNPLIKTLGLPVDEHGYLLAESDLRVRGLENIWAIGDCAHILDPGGKPYPATAQHALREGRLVAQNVPRVLRGQPTAPFVYRTEGTLAAFGCRTAVAQVFGLKLSGFWAWFLFRTVYLLKMPGLSRKLRVALDWTADLLFRREYVQLGIHRVRVASPAPVWQPSTLPPPQGDGRSDAPSPASSATIGAAAPSGTRMGGKLPLLF